MLRAAALVALAATAVPASAQFIGKLEFAEGRRATAQPGDTIRLTARMNFDNVDAFVPGLSALGGYGIRIYGTSSPHYEIQNVSPAFHGTYDRITDNRTMFVTGAQVVVGAPPSQVNTSARVNLVSFDIEIDDHWDGRPIVLNLTPLDYRPRHIGFYLNRNEPTTLSGPVVSGFFIIEPRSTEPEEPTADMNGDGQVNVSDLIAFLTAFGAANTQADMNGDGQVNVSDLIAFLNMFGAAS